jgi:hypothetical protein
MNLKPMAIYGLNPYLCIILILVSFKYGTWRGERKERGDTQQWWELVLYVFLCFSKGSLERRVYFVLRICACFILVYCL